VESNPNAAGEDEPIYRRRLERDGWELRQEWVTEWRGIGPGYRTVTPEVRVKRAAGDAGSVAVMLERRIDKLSYRERFLIEGAQDDPELPPGPLDWLDFDKSGRLIALSGGRVWAASVDDGRVARFRELLDLRGDRPEAREAPERAGRW
jgi:hypothetical protein